MSYLPSLFTACAALATTVWPTAAANGVWQALDLATEGFEKRANAGEIPCVAVDYALQPSAEWGLTNHVEAGSVTFYYVAHRDGGVKSVVAQAEALRDYVLANGIAFGQVVEWPAVRFDMSLPANQYFLNGNKPFVAAAVVLQVVVGVTNP
jgi:hypothetical protein